MLLFVHKPQDYSDRIIQTNVWKNVQAQLTEIKLEIDLVFLNVLFLVVHYIILLKTKKEFACKSAKMILGDFNLQEYVFKILLIVGLYGQITLLISVLLSVLKLLEHLGTLQQKRVFQFVLTDHMLMIIVELVLRVVSKILAMDMTLLPTTKLIFVKKYANKRELLLILKLLTDTVF